MIQIHTVQWTLTYPDTSVPKMNVIQLSGLLSNFHYIVIMILCSQTCVRISEDSLYSIRTATNVATKIKLVLITDISDSDSTSMLYSEIVHNSLKHGVLFL